MNLLPDHDLRAVGALAVHAGAVLLRIVGTLAVSAVILIPLERIAPLKKAGILRAALLTDLIYYFIATIVPYRLMVGPTHALAWAFHGQPFSTLAAVVGGLPLWVRLLAALVVNETGIYWGHRLCHEVPFLWRFHAVHHSPEHMDFWVGNRLHPLDPAFTALCGLVPVYALGLAAADNGAGTLTAAGLALLSGAWHFFIHANTRVRLGFVEQLLTSPAFHHWHHSREDPIDRNYANLLPWLDRIFGTYHLPPKDWPAAYGLRDPISPNIVGQLVDPLIPPASFLRRGLARASQASPPAG